MKPKDLVLEQMGYIPPKPPNIVWREHELVHALTKLLKRYERIAIYQELLADNRLINGSNRSKYSDNVIKTIHNIRE